MSETADKGNGGDQKQVLAAAQKGKGKPPSKRAPSKVKKRASKKKKSEGSGCGRTIAILTGLLVVVGAATFMVFIEPQRADLQIDRIGTTTLTPDQLLKFGLYLHNYGQIDAQLTRHCAEFVNAEKSRGDWAKTPVLGCGPLIAVIPAGRTRLVTFNIYSSRGRPIIMPQAMTAEIASGKRPAYLFGRVEYRDAYTWLLSPFGIFGPSALRYCERYDAPEAVWAGCNNPDYPG